MRVNIFLAILAVILAVPCWITIVDESVEDFVDPNAIPMLFPGFSRDLVSVIEIKRTDWDRMKPHRVRPNVQRHARQVWRYIEPFLDDEDPRDACPGIIYEHVPTVPGRVEEIETVLNERAIQVVWRTESMDELRERLGNSAS